MPPAPGLVRPLPPDLLVRRTIFESPLVAVGIFRAGVGHPDFRDAGEIDRHLLAFPRNAVRIRPEGEEPFLADPGTVACYNAGQVLTREAVDPAGDACDLVALRADALLEIAAADDPRVLDAPDRPFTVSHGPTDAATYALQRQVVRAVEASPPADALRVEETVLRIVRAVVARARSGAPGAGRDPAESAGAELAEAVRRHVALHYREKTSLDEIAARFGRSVYHTSRVFHRYQGTTIHRFRLQLRLRRSLELVAERSSDLSRVALHLGFAGHSHFTAAFRRAFGLTPSEFRRNPSLRRMRELADRVGGARS